MLSELATAVLTELHGQGVQMAVDNVGTGYSSLAYLTRVPTREVKIDRSFVQGMSRSLEHAAVVQAIADLARRLGLRTVAVGVEPAEEAESLRRLGCNACQGYYFGAPMTPAQLLTFLKTAAEQTRPADIARLPRRDAS